MNAAIFNNSKDMKIKGVNLYRDDINDRLKLLEYDCISKSVIQEIISFAANEKLGKILSVCHGEVVTLFDECGFIVEGTIPGFFKGEDGYCISYYVDTNRKISKKEMVENDILQRCLNNVSLFAPMNNQNILIRDADEKDIPQMIDLFLAVFKTYPTPVFSSEYLKNVMNKKTYFKVAVQGDKIISIASAELDTVNLNAEMTDCTTYPEYRGRGLLTNLIYQLEVDLKVQGFYNLYSLCRATEIGINKALCNLQYQYTGRLVNNCDICGDFEDMNIWVKKLI